MRFSACGHSNITATHSTTLEFTKDSDVTERGDCITGIKADFDPKDIKVFSASILKNRLKIIIRCKNIKEEITAELNLTFSDEKEMVIRKSDFVDERTFAINADKAAVDLSRDFVKMLQNPDSKIEVTVEECKRDS